MSHTSVYTPAFCQYPDEDAPPVVVDTSDAGSPRPTLCLDLHVGGDQLSLHFADLADLRRFADGIAKAAWEHDVEPHKHGHHEHEWTEVNRYTCPCGEVMPL